MQENPFDAIARQQLAERQLALQAREQFRHLSEKPPEELTKMFLAICRAGEKFDPNHKCRKRILRLLPDVCLMELIGVRVPTKIAQIVERRLAPRTEWGDDSYATLR